MSYMSELCFSEGREAKALLPRFDFAMTDQSESRSPPRTSGRRRRSKQEPQGLQWPRPNFIRRRLPRSNFPYPSSNTTPMLPAPPTGVSREAMVNTEDPTRMQTTQQRCHSFEIAGMTREISGPSNTAHPYNSSALAPTMYPPRLELHDMSGDYRNFLAECSSPAQVRHWMYEESVPVFIELRHVSPDEEEFRITQDLSALWNFLPLRNLDDACIQQALREHSWLHGEKRRLIERLDRLPFEFRDLDEIGCLDIDQLSINGQHGHEQVAPLPLTTRPGAYHLDDNKSSRAKSQLDLYNKRWKEIQAQSAEASTASSVSALPAIPWPQTSPFRTSQFQVELNAGNATTETLSWKWATHAFFVEAFGLHPLFETDEKNEVTFGFVSDHGSRETVARLKGLRRQMKLEKVRWHEDKMKAIFGPTAATLERVKAVWSAVINLRDSIEQELEALQD